MCLRWNETVLVEMPSLARGGLVVVAFDQQLQQLGLLRRQMIRGALPADGTRGTA